MRPSELVCWPVVLALVLLASLSSAVINNTVPFRTFREIQGNVSAILAPQNEAVVRAARNGTAEVPIRSKRGYCGRGSAVYGTPEDPLCVIVISYDQKHKVLAQARSTWLKGVKVCCVSGLCL